MEITTNNKPRELISFYDLTHDERKDFDYLRSEDEFYDARFFRYKGNVYDTQDCEPIVWTRVQDYTSLKSWTGLFTETYFSGVVFRYAVENDEFDPDYVIVGRYCT